MAGHSILALVVAIVLCGPVPAAGRGAALPPPAFPDPARVWGPDDYLKADAILRLSAASDFPRSSAAVFRRIVDGRNVAAARDHRVPLLRRLIDLRCYDGFIGSFRARYNVAASRGERLGEELVALQEFLLELSALTVELTEPFAGALDPEEGRALAQMRFFGTYATLKDHLLGVVRSLGEHAIYSDGQRLRLAEAVERHLPVLRATLARRERAALAATLERLAASAREPGLGALLLRAAGTAASE